MEFDDENRPVYSINWKDVVLLESPVRKQMKHDGFGQFLRQLKKQRESLELEMVSAASHHDYCAGMDKGMTNRFVEYILTESRKMHDRIEMLQSQLSELTEQSSKQNEAWSPFRGCSSSCRRCGRRYGPFDMHGAYEGEDGEGIIRAARSWRGSCGACWTRNVAVRGLLPIVGNLWKMR